MHVPPTHQINQLLNQFNDQWTESYVASNITLTPIETGLTNKVYKLSTKTNQRFLLRIYGYAVDPAQTRLLQDIGDLGLAPKLNFHNEIGSVEEWIEGRQMTRHEIQEPKYYDLIMRKLASLHRHNITHNDLHHNNVLIVAGTDGTEDVQLLDFEFAKKECTVTEKSWDIANFFCEFAYHYESSDWGTYHAHEYPSTATQLQIIESYLGHATSTLSPVDVLCVIESQTNLIHERWIEWALEKHRMTQDIEYLNYAQHRAENSPEMMEKYGKTIYVDGTFDLLHIGHLQFLQATRRIDVCKQLIVGIMSDKDVLSYKRLPTLPATERGEMVAAVKGVDRVIVDAPFMHDVTAEFLDANEIDLIAYGGDPKLGPDALGVWYDHYKVGIERGIMRSIPYSDKQSTSAILCKVKGC
jgi:cytidyltransferase-like protein